MNIIWSATAEKTYLLVIEQILEKWTVKEARRFMSDVDRLLLLLNKDPRICPKSKIYSLRKCLVNEHISLIHKNYKSRIELVTFIYNRSGHAF